jgi:hypothetical protein
MKYRVIMLVTVDVKADGPFAATLNAEATVRRSFDSLNQDSEYEFGRPVISELYAERLEEDSQ